MSIPKFIDAGQPASIRSERETFIASGTIAAGDWVSFDSSKTGTDRVLYVKVTDTSLGAVALGVPTVGVALEAAVDGEQVQVVTSGYVAEANVATSVAADVAVALDTTTSGRATTADAANVNIAGITLAVAASNKAPCWVLKRF